MGRQWFFKEAGKCYLKKTNMSLDTFMMQENVSPAIVKYFVVYSFVFIYSIFK